MYAQRTGAAIASIYAKMQLHAHHLHTSCPKAVPSSVEPVTPSQSMRALLTSVTDARTVVRMRCSCTALRSVAVRWRPYLFCVAAAPCEQRSVSGLRRCLPGLTPAGEPPKYTAPGPASWATMTRGAGCALRRIPTSSRHSPAAVAQQLHAGPAPVLNRPGLNPWKEQGFLRCPCVLRC